MNLPSIFVLSTLLFAPSPETHDTKSITLTERETITASNVATVTSFKDLPQSHWAHEAVMSAVDKGLFSGYTDGTFKPSNQVTRAEMASILVRSMPQVSGSGSHTFADVASNHWAHDAIQQAVAVGIIEPKDYANNKFNPNQAMTRNEIVDWVVASLAAINPEYAKISKEITNGGLAVLPIQEHFTGTLAKSAYGDTAVVLGTGIMGGYEDGTFKPTGNTTRAEVATIVQRYMNVAEKAPSTFMGLTELHEIATTGTNLATMGFKSVHDGDLSMPFAKLRLEQHPHKSGNGTTRLNRIIAVDTSDRNNIQGMFKEVFKDNIKSAIEGAPNMDLVMLFTEHAFTPFKDTKDLGWYGSSSATHALLSPISVKGTAFTVYNVPSILTTYKTGMPPLNQEFMMWSSASVKDVISGYKIAHVVNGHGYYFTKPSRK